MSKFPSSKAEPPARTLRSLAVLSLSTFWFLSTSLASVFASTSAFALAAASLLMSFWSFVSNPEAPISSVDTPSFLTEASELEAEELSAGLAAEELFVCALVSAAGLAAEDGAALSAFAVFCSFLFAEASFFCSAFAALFDASAFFCSALVAESVFVAALVADLSVTELAALVGAALLAAELGAALCSFLTALPFCVVDCASLAGVTAFGAALLADVASLAGVTTALCASFASATLCTISVCDSLTVSAWAAVSVCIIPAPSIDNINAEAKTQCLFTLYIL